MSIRNFVGAAIVSQVRLFNMHPTGAMHAGPRLEALMGPGGIEDCDNAQNCVKVCPKGIPLTESLAAVNGQVLVHAVKSCFRGSQSPRTYVLRHGLSNFQRMIGFWWMNGT